MIGHTQPTRLYGTEGRLVDITRYKYIQRSFPEIWTKLDHCVPYKVMLSVSFKVNFFVTYKRPLYRPTLQSYRHPGI